MKKVTILFFTIFTVAGLYPQGYEINFAGTGQATVVDSVKVENLNQGISLALKGNDVLKLGTVTGIHNNTSDINLLEVYLYPMTEQAEIQFPVNESGIVMLAVYEVSGRSVIQSNLFLHPGMHKYRVTGLIQGMYIIRIHAQSSIYSAILVSENRASREAEIAYVSSNTLQLNQPQIETKHLKSAASVIVMPFDEGDRLKFTGMSGNYGTVLTYVPSGNSTITFDFTECKDADDNYYTVITLGIQIWMAENLETTRYNDGTAVPLVREDQVWTNLSTPAYCWYNNDSSTYKDLFGAFYNWFAVDTLSNGGKNVCPSGWHVPSDAEWTMLTNYLGGDNVAGGKLKETGTTHWDSPNTGATNETGFTMLGTGWRYGNGIFNDIGKYNCIWSNTVSDTSQAYYRELDWNQNYFLSYPWNKKCGFSVRCLKY